MIDQVIKNIKDTELSEEPFEHKFVNEVFPKEFYKNLIDNLPHKKDYMPLTINEVFSSS